MTGNEIIDWECGPLAQSRVAVECGQQQGLLMLRRYKQINTRPVLSLRLQFGAQVIVRRTNASKHS
jgi:hypothetical protein